jgi:putative DNA primase/helicase
VSVESYIAKVERDNEAAHKRVMQRASKLAASEVPVAQAGEGVTLLRADQVRMTPIKWLWPGWLAAGKLHVVAGQPGTGKTTIALAIAATLTSGGRWPDGTRYPARHDAIVWSGEDDPSDTLVPRLAVSGADLARVHFITGAHGPDGRRPFDPARDMPMVAERLAALRDVRVLILDPLVSAVAGDSHHNAEVRRSLQPVVDLAGEHGVAVVGITHYGKGTTGRDPIDRVIGSVAFGALARLVLATGKGQDGDRVLVRAKSNIGPDGGGFGYSLDHADHHGVTAGRILWGEPVEGSARDILGATEVSGDADDHERDDAAAWLADALAAGPLTAAEVRRQADEAGHAWRTVQRAMGAAGVVAKRTGFPSKTMWALVEKCPVAAVAPHLKAGATGATEGFGATGGEPEVVL